MTSRRTRRAACATTPAGVVSHASRRAGSRRPGLPSGYRCHSAPRTAVPPGCTHLTGPDKIQERTPHNISLNCVGIRASGSRLRGSGAAMCQRTLTRNNAHISGVPRAGTAARHDKPTRHLRSQHVRTRDQPHCVQTRELARHHAHHSTRATDGTAQAVNRARAPAPDMSGMCAPSQLAQLTRLLPVAGVSGSPDCGRRGGER